MDKKEIIERFCSLSAKVGEFFDSQFVYDCFCGSDMRFDESFNTYPFQFEETIVKFIEMCVIEKMNYIESMPDEIDVKIAKLQLIKELKAKS